jgi:hypothetical protein
MLHARKIYIPPRMKALLTDEMLAGIDLFFHLPAGVRWTRLHRAGDAGFSALLEHHSFPAFARLEDVPEERWDLFPD